MNATVLEFVIPSDDDNFRLHSVQLVDNFFSNKGILQINLPAHFPDIENTSDAIEKTAVVRSSSEAILLL